MASDGMRNRGGPTLTERLAATKASRMHHSQAQDATEPTPQTHSARQAHCWVHTPEQPSNPRPGLVIEWQRADTGWRARVVYALGDGEHATTVETWIDAERLGPA